MNLAELLTVDQILPEMRNTEHRAAIKELVDHLEEKGLLEALSKPEVLDLLFQREEQISTGIGSGVAIPHTFIPDLDHVITMFGRSKEGIDFSSLDNAPVHFVILFIVPKSQYQLHLRTLAAIAKLFSNSQIRKRLSRAEGRKEILQILANRP